jgi:hypothetical protein
MHRPLPDEPKINKKMPINVHDIANIVSKEKIVKESISFGKKKEKNMSQQINE